MMTPDRLAMVRHPRTPDLQAPSRAAPKPADRPLVRLLLRGAFVAAACAAGALGLQGAPASAQTTLRVAMTAGDIPDWTGQPDQGFEGGRFVAWSLYDSLINWDLSRPDVEAALKPGLAVSWTPDEKDPKRWIIRLRQGVKFHDGCDWNADVAVWNIARVTDDKSPQFNVVHFARNRSRTSNVVNAEKIDEHTIAINTREPESLFPFNIAYWFMISKCALDRVGNDYRQYALAPAGTGPYRFGGVVPRERLELVRNPDYWDKARVPKHDRLVLLPMPEATTRAAALLSGQVDMIEAPSPDTIPRLRSSGMTVITRPYPHNWHYQFNFQRGPFRDVRVRQAANYALNRQEMVDMLGGIAMESHSVFTPTQKIHGKPMRYAFDPKKATALLKEAGCHPCGVTIGISTSGSGQMQPLPMNELIKAQLEAAGFRVKLEVMDWNALLNVFWKGSQDFPQYDAVNVSLSTIDPNSGLLKHFTTANRSPNGLNWGWYDNKEVDRLAGEVLTTFDEARQTELLTKMHELITADAGRLFVVHDLNPRAHSPRVKGFVQAQSWFQDLTPIEIR